MSESKRVVNSFIWRLAERFGAQGVTFIVSIVLARLLDPKVYGILALVTVFTSILQVFIDSGLGTALIQKKDADDLDFSSVFYFNFAVCIVLYLIMFFAAPLIAAFYNNMPDLTRVIRVLSLTLLISGVKNIQQAYVSRHLLFKRFFFATLGGTLGAAVLGIYLAWKGYGVWALVGQYLFNTGMDTLILWITVKWRPKKMFSFERLKALLSFGWKLLGVSLLSTAYHDLRSLIIGKMYTPSDLAFYNRGKQLPQLISTNVDVSIDSVLLPTMARKQDNKEAVKRMSRLSIQLGTYVIMPIMVGLGVCAEPVIKLVLTDKWLPCVPFLRIFCYTFSFFPIFTTNYNAYKALGRSDLYLRVTIRSKLMGIAVLLSTMWFGVMWIAYGVILVNLLNQIICSMPSRKLFNYSYKEQFMDFAPNLVISLIMGALVYLVSLLRMNNIVILVLQVITGVVSYVALSVLSRNTSYRYILTQLKTHTRAKAQES